MQRLMVYLYTEFLDINRVLLSVIVNDIKVTDPTRSPLEKFADMTLSVPIDRKDRESDISSLKELNIRK